MGKGREKVKRGKDPLFNHGAKHKISVDPIYLIGDRIANSIDHARAKEIFKEYESGGYSSLREESLYFSRNKDGLHIPAHKIKASLAAKYLLIAIEIFSNISNIRGQVLTLPQQASRSSEDGENPILVFEQKNGSRDILHEDYYCQLLMSATE